MSAKYSLIVIAVVATLLVINSLWAKHISHSPEQQALETPRS